MDGHPAWQHTVQRELWIVHTSDYEPPDEDLEAAPWAVQKKEDLGTVEVELTLRDLNCLYPSDSNHLWYAYDTKVAESEGVYEGWQPEPTLRCLAMTAEEKVRREKAAAEEKKRLEKEAEEARLAQQRAQALADELIREEEESKQKTSAKAKRGAAARASARPRRRRSARPRRRRAQAEEEAASRGGGGSAA